MGNASPASSDSSKVSSPKKELDASQNGKKSKKAGGLVSYSYSSTAAATNKDAQSLSNNGKRSIDNSLSGRRGENSSNGKRSLDNSLSGRRGDSINGKRCLDRSQSGRRDSNNGVRNQDSSFDGNKEQQPNPISISHIAIEILNSKDNENNEPAPENPAHLASPALASADTIAIASSDGAVEKLDMNSLRTAEKPIDM